MSLKLWNYFQVLFLTFVSFVSFNPLFTSCSIISDKNRSPDRVFPILLASLHLLVIEEWVGVSFGDFDRVMTSRLQMFKHELSQESPDNDRI